MPKENKPNKIIKSAENFYDGLSAEDIEEIERVMLDRSNFFGERGNNPEELVDGITDESMQKAVDFIEKRRTNKL